MARKALSFIFIFGISLNVLAEPIDRRIHDELETGGGHSLGLGQGGMAAVSDISSVKFNPAMIGLEKKYSIFGSYHWPTFGRDFYQAGVIDSRTSKLAAGLLYSGFNDDFKLAEFDAADGKESLLSKRLGIGVSQVTGKVSLGLSVFFTQAYDVDQEVVSDPKTIKLTTFGLGMAGFLTPNMRFGLSAENLGNRKYPKIAPRFLRAGLAYLLQKGMTTLHLDYVNRQRIEGVEYGRVAEQSVFNGVAVAAPVAEKDTGPELKENEQMIIGSLSVKLYDLIRVLAAYGRDVTTERQSLSGGVALVNGNYSLSYASSRPYLSEETAHQAINLTMNISL